MSRTTRSNRQWRLVARPEGRVRESDFAWREETVPGLSDGQVLVRNVYLSLDPANRGWMNERKTYVDPIGIGDVVRGGTIGVVEESRHRNFEVGSVVQGAIGWQDYQVTDGRGVTRLPAEEGMPLTAYLGLFGHIGMTAYFGLLDIGKPRAGETLVVSAAAGAVGSVAGQIGRIKGCRVVGIAGGEEKCRWITEELGFDAAIDYKSQPVYEKLREHCPDGIDIYFENVGGEILDAVLAQINLRARIVLCGMISQYNATGRVPGPGNFINLLVQRARVEGFIVLDYLSRAREAMHDLTDWFAAGRIKYRVDVVDGLENAPAALNRLFDGTNKGKLIVRVSEEPPGRAREP